MEQGYDWRGTPVGAEGGYLAGFIALDDVDALEVGALAVFADRAASPLYGGGVSDDEDVVFGEGDDLKERHHAGDEFA